MVPLQGDDRAEHLDEGHVLMAVGAHELVARLRAPVDLELSFRDAQSHTRTRRAHPDKRRVSPSAPRRSSILHDLLRHKGFVIGRPLPLSLALLASHEFEIFVLRALRRE